MLNRSDGAMASCYQVNSDSGTAFAQVSTGCSYEMRWLYCAVKSASQPARQTPAQSQALQAINEQSLTAVAVRLHDKKAAVCKEAASGLVSIFRWSPCMR